MAQTIVNSIKRLAVSYAAYGRAVEEDDHNGIIVWGEELVEAQQITGVELHDEAGLSRHISMVKRIESRRKLSSESAEERAEREGTDPIDERNADQDECARVSA